jgi:hypothetical protein
MDQRNWLDLARKLVDRTDLNYTVVEIQQFIAQQSLSYFGEGVLTTTTYPNPFPITMDSGDFGGVVGNGIAYDPSGNEVTIYSASPTSKNFLISASDPTNPRYDLLVLQYKQTGQDLVAKPSDPITNVYLNLIDDFSLVVIPGTPSGVPAYPSKGPNDVILAGLRVPAMSSIGTQVTVDLSIREIAIAQKAVMPGFVQEVPSGTIDGTNRNFVLSGTPLTSQSLLVIVDGVALTMAEWTLTNNTVTLNVAPALGQDVYAYYVVNSSMSTNPLAAQQQTPSGVVNGTNNTFLLSGTPSDQASTLLFVDGVTVPTSGWSLSLSGSSSSIIFQNAYIPQPGQSVYVYYLINSSSMGTPAPTPVPVSGGAYVVNGSISSPFIIDPSAGLTPANNQRNIYIVKSPGGPTMILANPQIAPGTTIGQELLISGTSDTDYPVFEDGNGLSLNGELQLKINQDVYLYWRGDVWRETTRRS